MTEDMGGATGYAGYAEAYTHVKQGMLSKQKPLFYTVLIQFSSPKMHQIQNFPGLCSRLLTALPQTPSWWGDFDQSEPVSGVGGKSPRVNSNHGRLALILSLKLTLTLNH